MFILSKHCFIMEIVEQMFSVTFYKHFNDTNCNQQKLCMYNISNFVVKGALNYFNKHSLYADKSIH